jgi:hypothetical protein
VVQHTWSSEKSFGPVKREGRNKFLYPVVAREILREIDSLEYFKLNEDRDRL